MNDENKENKEEKDSSKTSALEKASEIGFDALVGLPGSAAVIKNLAKAAGQLFTTALDIPKAYLEGVAGEIRAVNKSREKLITATGDQIAATIDVDSEYADVAVKKYGQKILRGQVNLDKIGLVAVNQIKEDLSSVEEKVPAIESGVEKEEPKETELINDDWLNTFQNEASTKSTEEMQLIFGRILAGEIQKPGSFSIKTVKLMSELDSEVASLFQRFCSLCIHLKLDNEIIDARVLSLGGDAGQNALIDYGFGFTLLNILQEHGLIIADYNSKSDYRVCIANQDKQVELGFTYQNKLWGLLSTAERSENAALMLNGVALTNAGKELLSIVDVEPDEEYTSSLEKYFNDRQLKMVEIRNQ
jgi:hypothetical protein